MEVKLIPGTKNSSHLYKCLKNKNALSLFRKQFQIRYVEDDFFNASEEEIVKAKECGSRNVICFNTTIKKIFIFSSATDFIEVSGLSKKAVTVALAKNVVRNFGEWIPLYFNNENIARLDDYLKRSGFI